MAGDWIKMRVDLSEDPAVIAIADALQMDVFAVVGRLHRAWSWASAHTKDGRANVTEKFIDKLLTHDGFAHAMSDVGWLEVADAHVLFVRFNRHNSKSAKRRATEAARKKRVRKMSAKCPQNVRIESGQKADQRREEKRREDIDSANAESKGDKSPNRFIKPTVQQVRAYCSERKNRVDAVQFIDHYETNGWRRGKTPIKDWQACVRTWEQNDNGRAATAGRIPGLVHEDNYQSDFLVADDA